MNVLMIEDNEDDFRLFSAQVAQLQDSHIIGCKTLREGLAYLNSQPVDVLVLDLNLPDGRGLSVFDSVHAKAPSVPVVILSGSSTDELALEALQRGAQDFLVKGEFSGALLARTLRLAREQQRIRERLHQSEQRYSLLVNTIEGYGMYTLDLTGNITSWNRGAERIKGYRPDEIIGKNFSCFYTPEDTERDQPHTILEIARRTGQYIGEGWRVRKDGTRFWADLTVTALQDDNGQVVAFSKVTRDLTERKHAQEALKASEERYRLLASNLPDIAVLIYDQDYRYTLVEGSLMSHIGYDPAEMEGKTLHEVYAPAVADGLLDYYAAALRGENVHFERVGANDTYFEVQIVPIRDESNTIVGGMVVVHDITRRRQDEAALKESEERFRRAVQNAPFPIMIHAEDGQVLNINRQWTKITGYTHQDIPTISDWTERVYGERKDAVKEVVDSLYELDRLFDVGEYTIRTKSGNLRTWDARAAPLGPLADGRRVVITMAVDVTERNLLEKQNFELALDRERLLLLSQFVRNTSHDLRTPLSMILTSTHMLRRLPPERHAEKLDQIEAHVGDINKMLETVHYTAQLWSIDHLERDVEKLDLLLEAVCNRVAPRIAAKNQQLHISAEALSAPVASIYLSQAIFEILDNACSFTPEQGSINLRLSAGQGSVLITIQDNGIGMTEIETHQIFDVFWRADPSRSDYKEHHGLGMPIARRIIDLHGGSIEVSSQPQAGTTFTVTLPVPTD